MHGPVTYGCNIDNNKCHHYSDSCMDEINQSIEQLPWTVEGFVEAAQRLMLSSPELFASSDTGTGRELNVRLIRDYVVRGFIPRPGKSGREARFGLDHLVHLLAVRVLLRSQKWSLPAIRSSLGSTDTESLLSGVLAQIRARIEKEFSRAVKTAAREAGGGLTSGQGVPPLNPALQLIEKFKSSQASSMPFGTVPALPVTDIPGAAFRMSRSPSPAAAPAGPATRLHIPLEDWCEVVIDAGRAKSLKPAEIEALGESLKHSLKNNLP